MKKLEPMTFIFDYQRIKWFCRANKLLNGPDDELENCLFNFIAKYSCNNINYDSLINFTFPKDNEDFRYEWMVKERKCSIEQCDKLREIFSFLEKEIGKSEIKIYMWW